MKLTKVHRVLKFKQSGWMKKYIDLNTEQRKNAVSDFEKDFFEMMINYNNGKTMEKLRKRMKYTSRPTHITHKILDKDFAAIHKIKPVLIINKPIYIGFTVLELSKWLTYDFHCNVIKKNFDAKLLFTDRHSYL